MRNLEEALVEVDHVRKKFHHEGYQKAFEKIMHFLNDLHDFLSGEAYISTQLGLKRKKGNEPVVLKLDTLTDHQKNVLWLSPPDSQNNKRDFRLVKNAFELLTNADKRGRNFLPTRARDIVSSFIYTYNYIFSPGKFSI